MFGLRKKLPQGIFEGACDVHCHILPGVDDGFPTVEKSLHALKKLEEHGIKKMVLNFTCFISFHVKILFTGKQLR